MSSHVVAPLFPLGQVLVTINADKALQESGQDVNIFLSRHARGDWGEVDAEDAQMNNAAIDQGNRLLSAFVLANGIKLWIITEWDRSATTILTPDEY